ncbi:MAG: hypothetical protein KDD69_02850 [Bdellovibrionales bacterium]|nr:hypothetical protein [Bdellovibrionales bacterium]
MTRRLGIAAAIVVTLFGIFGAAVDPVWYNIPHIEDEPQATRFFYLALTLLGLLATFAASFKSRYIEGVVEEIKPDWTASSYELLVKLDGYKRLFRVSTELPNAIAIREEGKVRLTVLTSPLIAWCCSGRVIKVTLPVR